MDAGARILAGALPDHLRQAVVVENRSGAGGVLGMDAVAKAAPDGYTLGYGSLGPVGVGASLLANPPYDSRKDFAPVSIVGSVPSMIVVRPGLGAGTLQDLLRLARERPGRVTYASAGIGSTPQLAFELLKLRTGVDITHVAYRGAAPAITALIAGEVDCTSLDVMVLLPQVREGRLRALAVASRTRSPAVPEVPTTAEAGLPDVVVENWYAVLAPAGTPRDRVERLHAAVAAAVARPETARRFTEQGTRVIANQPEEATAFIRAEVARWAEVVRAANIRAD
ncbi:MAG: tripartite tricarboxylate transporter substrate binding protein [Acetobacteraceae bacterium]|nr:tripartite tricarboxylate transporter substrate binding protein [Acetobacteraceae bacterium]